MSIFFPEFIERIIIFKEAKVNLTNKIVLNILNFNQVFKMFVVWTELINVFTQMLSNFSDFFFNVLPLIFYMIQFQN